MKHKYASKVGEPKLTQAPIKSAPSLSDEDNKPQVSHDSIEQRAYFLWLEYGKPEDRSVEIWLEAERTQ